MDIEAIIIGFEMDYLAPVSSGLFDSYTEFYIRRDNGTHIQVAKSILYKDSEFEESKNVEKSTELWKDVFETIKEDIMEVIPNLQTNDLIKPSDIYGNIEVVNERGNVVSRYIVNYNSQTGYSFGKF